MPPVPCPRSRCRSRTPTPPAPPAPAPAARAAPRRPAPPSSSPSPARATTAALEARAGRRARRPPAGGAPGDHRQEPARARAPTSVPAGATSRPQARRERDARRGTRLREPDGLPTLSNPGLSLAIPGAAPIGVPNFFIDKFRIPPFLLSIYQAAGIEYGIRWEVLAAINEIETDYGRNLNVSSAGALGWMQFMPATWKQYGIDANGDKKKDPYNPVDAIFSAARYLKAAGAREGPAPRDLRLQPRRLVRRLGPHARAPDRRPADRTSSARSPA